MAVITTYCRFCSTTIQADVAANPHPICAAAECKQAQVRRRKRRKIVMRRAPDVNMWQHYDGFGNYKGNVKVSAARLTGRAVGPYTVQWTTFMGTYTRKFDTLAQALRFARGGCGRTAA